MEKIAQRDTPGLLAPPRTRDRVLATFCEHPSGLTIAELAAVLGLKHNAVRKHLVALAKAGSIAAERLPPMSVGRPATRYRIVPSATPGYADRTLSRMLLQAVGGVDVSQAERIAFEMHPAQPLEDTLSALGFAPADVTSAAERDAGRRTIELRACPFLELVAEPHGKLICAFHRGLVRRDMPTGAELREFRVAPRGLRCRIVLAGVTDRPEGARA